MRSYTTVSEAVSDLKRRGYTIDFNLGYDCISCHRTTVSLLPSEFEITEVYRFEGDTDPADEAVVYAVESKHGQKGVLVNAFGIYSDPVSDEMIKRLTIRHA